VKLRRRPVSLRRFTATSETGAVLKLDVPSATGSRDGSIVDDLREFEIRVEPYEIWMLLDEQTIAYASGNVTGWSILLDQVKYDILQPKPGFDKSDILREGRQFGTISATKVGLDVTLQMSSRFDPAVEAFFAMVAIMGWRQTRATMVAGSGGDGGFGDGGGGGGGDGGGGG
jgi:hypothetical protein